MTQTQTSQQTAAPAERKPSLGERVLQRYGHRYILMMMVFTRIFGSVGGLLVIYYVELTLEMPDQVRSHFRAASAVVVVVGCTLTVLLALWETRRLRKVLRLFHLGQQPDAELAAAAGRDAVLFTTRHHWQETWLVPCSTLVPVLIFLKVMDNADLTVLSNITVTVFMGISMALMSTFFAVEHYMKPVILSLLNRGVRIDYDSLPAGHLRFRFGVCFVLIVVTTALMIGTMARQRATYIIDEPDPGSAERAVAQLRLHSAYITVASVAIGGVFAALLASSVASRARHLVSAMQRVADGNLTERVQLTGRDEIDVLGRQFNEMVGQLENHDRTVRDLNINLEHKVQERTQQLERTLQELREAQSQLTDVAHRAGMAEIATGVLHNVGNALNSVNIATSLATERLRRSKLDELQKFVQRLTEKGENLKDFLCADDHAEKLLNYFSAASGRLAEEKHRALRELEGLTEKVEHIRRIITSQQNYARRVSFREHVDLHALVRDILEMHELSLAKNGVQVVRNFLKVGTAFLEKSKLMQVVDNLIKNATDAMLEVDEQARILSVTVAPRGEGRAAIMVNDTGGGIHPENFEAIFTYGFTTKLTGNGFGLHATALAMSELGGTIEAHSDGPGKGATFIVEFPLDVDVNPEDASGRSAAVGADENQPACPVETAC